MDLKNWLKPLSRFFIGIAILFIAHKGYSQVTCDYIIQATTGCAPLVILATATETTPSNDPVVSRRWELLTSPGSVLVQGYGPAPLPQFSYIVAVPGDYCLNLTSTTLSGNTCTVSKCNIKVAATPTIGFTFTNVEGCAPLTSTVVCQSTPGCGSIDSIKVDWGCGLPEKFFTCPAGPFPHTFLCPPGNSASPRVIVYNSCGCFADTTYNRLINVLSKPVARFNADVTTVNCATGPHTVNFTADSVPAPNMTYSWYIGNSPTPAQTGPSRFFTSTFAISPFCYSIKLKVSHNTGGACVDSLIKVDFICVRPQPIVDFTANADTLCINGSNPGTLELTNTTPGLNSLNWSVTGPNGPLQPQVGNTATYTITAIGAYTVTASGAFGPGCSATKSAQVLIALAKPVSEFTVNDNFSCSIPFLPTLSAVTCPGCTYAWSHTAATPTTSSGATVSPSFNAFGSFAVRLTTRAANGCTDVLTKNNFITLRKIVPRIAVNGSKGCGPLSITFTDTTNLINFPDSIASVNWSFTGPPPAIGSSTAHSFTRTFNTPGCYTPMLVLATTTGCTDTARLQDSICVGTGPTCTVSTNKNTICYKDTVDFTMNCNFFDIIIVDHGDKTGPMPFKTALWNHVFEDTGMLTVTIIPYSDSCSRDTFKIVINVLPPIADFKDTVQCAFGDTTFLLNKSGGATSYKWYFCTGDSITAIDTFAIFPPCTTCTVTLKAENVNGCTNTKTLNITTPCDSVGFLPRDTSGCAPLVVQFVNTSPSNTPSFTRWDWSVPPLNYTGTNTAPGNVATRTFGAGAHRIAMFNKNAAGCNDTLFGTVNVCGLDAVLATGLNVCLPLPLCFQDLSTGLTCDSTFWRWDFGDGTFSDEQNPCHVFGSPRTYRVKMRVWNNLGCIDSIERNVVAAEEIALNYNIDTLICPGKSQCIVNNSVGSPGVPLKWEWSMPAASPASFSTDSAPCFSYQNAGDYYVYLKITSGTKCTVYDTVLVHNQSPVAGGYVSLDTISCPNPPTFIQFNDTSKFVDSMWLWNFGTNEGVSVIRNASKAYSTPGEYVVTLTVTTKQGCVDSAVIDTIVVKGPYGDFGFAPPGMCACKDTIYFNVSTVDAISLTLVYGCSQGFAIDSPITPVGTPNNPTISPFQFSYCIADTCQPQLIFGDASGCKVFKDQPYIPIDSPIVKFTYDNYGVCVKGTVCFHDSTSYHLNTNYSWTVFREWDFGDPGSGAANRISGTHDSLANPCHYYSQPGGYAAKLYVRSNLGCWDSSVVNIVVIPEYPRAGFYAEDSLVCANSPLCFQDTSDIYPLTGPDYWVVDFGDGIDTFTTSRFCHTYKTGGYYRVKMCVYDSIGCPDCDSSVVVRVIDNPIANAGADRNICYGIVTQLNGTGGINSFWEPAGLFSNPNSYNPTIQLYNDTVITFAVIDQYQCADTDTVTLRISRVFADFNVGASFCREDTVCVADASTNFNGTLVSWIYDFGNNDIVTSGTPDICYNYLLNNSGSYDITLTAIDNNGCTDTAVKTITIFPSPQAGFSLNDTSICSDQQLCVTDASTSITQILSWAWNYGNGANPVSGQAQPCYSYTPPFLPSYPVSLTITDQNGCTDTAVIVVTVNQKPKANFSWSASCESDLMPLANLSTQGTGSIIACEWILWVGAPSPVIDTKCNTSFQFPAGSYPVMLKVTDVNTCTDSIIRTVVSDSLSRLTVTPGDTSICLGSAVDYSVSGIFDQIDWTPKVWASSYTSPVVTINPLANISYIVSATNGVCSAASDTFTIRTIQPIPIECEANRTEVVLGISSDIKATVPGRIDSIIWSPDESLDCRDCPNPIALPTKTTTYTATIYYSENGTICTNTCELTITVLGECDGKSAYLPNTFTPNGDGLNDVLMIRGIAINKINYFRVFDRWGKMVFNAETGVPNEPEWGWHGTDLTGRQLNSGVYVYTCEIVCITGEIITRKGNVTLVR